ncbi:MAG: hypothetical protein V1776_04390 [Candidatus Diapherotrites archaeon]
MSMHTSHWLGLLGIGILLFGGCINGGNQPVPPDGQGNILPPSSIESGWWMYSPSQADVNPWQVVDIPFNKQKEEYAQVVDWIEFNNIQTDAIGFIQGNEITCAALNCPRGDYLIVKPTDAPARIFFEQNGFTPYVGAGIFAHVEENNISTTIFNATQNSIYFGGCNDFIPAKKIGTDFIPQPIQTCVWEGIPHVLEKGKFQTTEWTPAANGEYKMLFSYGIGCMSDTPLSEAKCTHMEEVNSLPILFTHALTTNLMTFSHSILGGGKNDWQTLSDEIGSETNSLLFEEWLNMHGIYPNSITFIPSPETSSCSSTDCTIGTFRIVASSYDKEALESIGFTWNGFYSQVQATPNYDAAQWFVGTPYQCFANKWNVGMTPVRSIGTDFQNMKTWLESEGITVNYIALIRGFSLSQQCNKLSNDKYAVGTTDEDSAFILPSLGFAAAGLTQIKLFTDTTNEEPLALIYKSKFCYIPPWGEPGMTIGSEDKIVQRATEWLAENGIPSLEGPTLYSINPSTTGSCDTDSGMALKVTLPAWTKPHLLALGFQEPSYSFEQTSTLIYPLNEENN